MTAPAPALGVEPSAAVARDIARSSDLIGIEVPVTTLLAVLLAWTQLFGLLGFELFGQTLGLVEDHAALLRSAASAMAAVAGL